MKIYSYLHLKLKFKKFKLALKANLSLIFSRINASNIWFVVRVNLHSYTQRDAFDADIFTDFCNTSTINIATHHAHEGTQA